MTPEIPDRPVLVPLADDDRYGPGALLTPANAITIVRLALAPGLLVMLVREPWAGAPAVPGCRARRFGTTRSGAFLDPLADKVLVLGAMFALVAANRFWVLPVA